MTTYQAGEPAAVIHDIRYSRFTGDLRPRRSAVLALARSSALRGLGIRRSAAAKIWPFLLVAGCFAPSVVAVGVPLLLSRVNIGAPTDVLTYWACLSVTTTLLIAYTASTIPSLLTRERRDRVLSLYFSTAVSPAEYVVGKILAALSLLLLVTFGPLLVMWIGGVLVAKHPGSWAQHNASELPKLLLAALVVVLMHAAMALALGSLTPKRVFAVGGYVALVLVPAVLGGVLYGLTHQVNFLVLVFAQVPLVVAAHVLNAQSQIQDPSFPHLGPALAVWGLLVVVGVGALALRYRRGAAA